LSQLASRSWTRKAVIVVLLSVLVVLAVYVRSAGSYGKALAPQSSFAPKQRSFQNEIADAFLAHQLSLRIHPPEGLARLRDPYEPSVNYRYQGDLGDLSLYKGKLYAYFGPAPAILLYIPFRVLQAGDMTPPLATLLFCTVGFLFSLALFRALVLWCCGRIPPWMYVAAVFTLGLGTPVAWMIHVGRDYEATIACGYMLLFAGLYFLARGALASPNAGALAVGGAALGLAVGARPTMAVAGVFILAAAIYVVRTSPTPKRRNLSLVALLAPYATIGVLLAFYNYARFDSILEFGQSYQLAGLNPQTYPFGRLSYVPRGLYYYLLSPGRVLGDAPYLFLRKSTINYDLLRAGGHAYMIEPIAGLLTSMPAAVVGYLLLAIRFRGTTRRFPRVVPVIVVLLVPSVMVLLLISYRFQSATMRYDLEFAPLIVLGSLLGWVAWNRNSGRSSRSGAFGNAAWLAAVAVSVAFNVAITFTPCRVAGSCNASIITAAGSPSQPSASLRASAADSLATSCRALRRRNGPESRSLPARMRPLGRASVPEQSPGADRD
jgi:hypothetical protein